MQTGTKAFVTILNTEELHFLAPFLLTESEATVDGDCTRTCIVKLVMDF
jgi:hypothetical protein